MEEWSEQFRPVDAADILGQADAVYDTTGFLRRSERRNLILEGPSGCGKTTTALNYAKGLFCEKSAMLGKACGDCRGCAAFDAETIPSFLLINGGLLHLDLARDWMGFVQRDTPLFGEQYVYMVDEARNLAPAVCDLLVTEMERPTSPAVFIFSLLEARELPAPVRGRCAIITLAAPSAGDRQRYLERLASFKDVKADAAALQLLAATGADFRTVAQNLQLAAGEGTVTATAVTRRFAPDASLAWSVLLAAVKGTPDETIAELSTNARSPEALRQTFEAMLVDAGLTLAANLQLQAPLQADIAALAPSQRLGLAHALRAAEERHGGDGQALGARLREYWSAAPDGMTRPKLAAALLDFRALVGEMQIDQPSRLPKRPAAVAAAPAAEDHALSLDQVREIYEAATFMVQAHGVTANYRIRFTAPAGMPDTKAAAQAGGLLNELGARLHAWCGSTKTPLHYIALHHRKEGHGLAISAVMHLPEMTHVRATQWLSKRLATRDDGLRGEGCGELLHTQTKGAMRLHWELIRELWRGVSPSLRLGTGELLLDKLQVAKASRGEIGAVSGRRYSTSALIGTGARARARTARMAHLSAFEDKAWSWLFRGWEIWEFGGRRQEELERREQMRELKSRFPDAAGLERQTLEARTRQLRRSWPVDPRRRSRAWKAWFEE